MTLTKYISDLLYRYECVIVPQFGGFVTNTFSATINHHTNTFNAPSKQITFNAQLQHSDGLLAYYIAKIENISYTQAVSNINQEVKQWHSKLLNNELDLENIGSFSLNKEGNILFEPNHSVNYLSDSFGMKAVVSPPIKRLSYKQQVSDLKTITPVIPTRNSRTKTPAFLKYAATAAIAIALGTVGWKEYQQIEYRKLVVKADQEQQKVEKTIQEATFVIDNPLPMITLNVAKEKSYKFHIIAGAFRVPSNAEKRVKQLLKKGYNAKILPMNKWNLTPVSYESFQTKVEAVNKLCLIQKTDSKDAWILFTKN